MTHDSTVWELKKRIVALLQVDSLPVLTVYNTTVHGHRCPILLFMMCQTGPSRT